MTSRHVAALLANDELDVILPLGALEQHGPHLPLATDQIIAEAIAVGAAERVGHCMIAPSVPVGASSHHLTFAGTASLPDQVLVDLLTQVVDNLLGHGFRGVYVITGHAGNSGAMKTLDSTTDDRSLCFADWPAQRQAIHDVAERELGLSADTVGTHAGHFETSIMLLLRPDLVQLDQAEAGFIGAPSEAGAALRRDGMAALSPIGVIGDPTGANAGAGDLYLTALIDHVVGGIERHRASREKPGS